jgi:hypothetical protein
MIAIARQLLNCHFCQSVGAYNGGPRNPNAEDAAGVQLVALYARILERVTATNEQATVESLERGMSASPDQLSASSGNPE